MGDDIGAIARLTSGLKRFHDVVFVVKLLRSEA